jgi:hypothetical protein
MKTLKIIQASRNQKPFITNGKKYEVLEDGKNTYKIKNDLGKISHQSKSDFWNTAEEKRYGFEFVGGYYPMLIIPTPVLFYDSYSKELFCAIVIPFIGFGFSYTLKPKL